MENKVWVAGIDMSGQFPELAYSSGGSEPKQIFEPSDEPFVGDVSVIVTQALAKLGADTFASICVAVDELTESVMADITEKIYRVCPDTELTFISRSESVAHYSLNQKKELRINDVAFFDLDEAGLIYNRFHMISTVGGKNNVFVERGDCSDIIKLESLEKEEQEVLDERFKHIINELFDKQHISTVYLTGKGFINEEWAKDSLNMLCNKRRVFKGQSLYAIGACYYNLADSGECRIVCDGRTAYETCLEVIYKEEKKEAVLIPAGKLLHEIGEVVVEGIVAGEQTKLVFIRRALFGKEVLRAEIELGEIEDYKDRMLRLLINLRIANGNELLVSVEDAGFGAFVKPVGLRTERILGRA